MKTKNVLTILVLFTGILFSCSNNDTDEKLRDKRVAVQFNSSISSGTRAAGTTWTAGDRIGIFMTNANAMLADASISEHVSNIAYTTTGDGKFTPAEGASTIYFPIQGTVDFYAYYPQQTVTNYQIAVNVADQSNPETIDLMYATAKGKDKTNPFVSLSFAHQLTNLVLEVQPGEGMTVADLANLTITVKSQNTTASYNLVDGTLTNAASPADITMKATTAGSRYEAILIPTNAENRILEFNLNNGHDAAIQWTMQGTLDVGMKYNFTKVKISRTAAEVEGNILPWTEITDDNENEAK